MKEVIIIDPIKDKRWDAFVESHPYGWICHLSGWKKALEKSFPHMKGNYLVVINNTSDTIQAALPLFEVKSWLIGKRLVSIPFATLSDPLISDSNDFEILFDAALRLSEEIRISQIEIQTLKSSSLIPDSRFGVCSFYKHHFLSLNPGPEQLKKHFHRTCVRQRIDKALKSNLSLSEVITESDVQRFYQLYIMTRKRLGLPPQPYIFIKSLWEEFFPSKRISILFAKHKEKAVAGIILFKFNDRVSVEFSVLDEAFRNLSPVHYLFWEAIKSAFHEGYKIFDFGRTALTNVTLMDFKNRWGTQVIDLPKFHYPREADKGNGTFKRLLNYKVIQNICKNAPQSVLLAIGRFCYRHLG
jgi:serine/alanine adding enzyme